MTRVNLPQTPDRYRRTSASLCAPPPLSSPYRRQPPHPRPPLTTPSPSSTGSHGQLDHHHYHRHPPRVPRDPSRPRATLPIPPKPSANAAIHVDANPRPMTRPPTGSRLFLPIFQPRTRISIENARNHRNRSSSLCVLSVEILNAHVDVRDSPRFQANRSVETRFLLPNFSPVLPSPNIPSIVSYPSLGVQSWRRAIY